MLRILPLRQCSKCKARKPFSAFNKDTGKNARKDGYYGQCKACCAASIAGRAARRKYYAANKAKWAEKYIKTDRAKVRRAVAQAKRRARLLQAMPKWANEFFIEEAYDLAARRTKITGFLWVVDHIVPLQGRRVSGLHVENNLQVIPETVNLRKFNHHA